MSMSDGMLRVPRAFFIIFEKRTYAMKTLQKTFAAMIAGVSLVAGASAASAQTTFTPGEAIKASGTLNQSLLGTDATVCAVTFHGHVLGDAAGNVTGFKFDSYEGTQTGGDGDLACDNSIQFDANDVTANFVSATQLNVPHILISTRLGSCEGTNITLDWSNPSVTFPVGTIIDPVCQFDGTLTVSAE